MSESHRRCKISNLTPKQQKLNDTIQKNYNHNEFGYQYFNHADKKKSHFFSTKIWQE